LFYFFITQGDLVAQKNERLFLDSVFAKYADTTINAYSPTKPYYTIVNPFVISPSVKTVRKINEKISIVKVPTQTAFNSLSRQMKIAAAKDVWKLSPAAEKLVERNKDIEQKYIVTGQNIDELLQALQNKRKD
jgi:hypothetical protein